MKKIQIKNLLLLTLLSIGIFSCVEENTDNSTLTNLKTNELDSILRQPIRFPENTIVLSEKAQNQTENWLLYEAMKSEIERMKNYTLDDAIANSSTILRATDTLLKTIPSKFKTKPIEARVKVLHTKASVLNQLSQKKQKDYNQIKVVAEEVPIDFLNLTIQLNEIFIELPNFEN